MRKYESSRVKIKDKCQVVKNDHLQSFSTW